MGNLEKLREFIRRRCVRFGEFQLANAGKSDFYIDGKQLTFDGEGGYLLAQVIFDKIKDLEIQGIGGIVLGSIPIAVAVSIFSLTQGKTISPFAVRKEVKSHGTQSAVEGSLKPGDRVVIVEDVVSTGGSVIESIKRVEEAGGNILKVISIVDREKGGREAIESLGYPYEPLFTIDDLDIDGLRKERK